ncbi:MAG: Stk1 family PASTA domain-containing Ser/Thr kinase [Gudongella sp.]|nr:Stk1 family PASTA domain-containing Ser/Thr kinase [Gudongella sp.]
MISRLLGNRYEIVEKIGSGGMADVYRAKCHLLDRFVAVKILKDEFTEDEDFIRKFRRESQAAASLSHPNILNIYDVGSDEQDGKMVHYIVMEYIKGKTLKDIIISKGKLSEEETLYYATQIGEALNHAHENHIIHRDIKPHNIMVTEDKRVKVTDFGIARAVTSSTITTTSDVLGSVHYFSPEQARGGYTDEKSDIYSLGIVMYEMITGKLPFNGDTPIGIALKHVQEEMIPPMEALSGIPVELNNIIMKCVQKRQGDRYPSAKALLLDLKNYSSTRKLSQEIVSEDTEQLTRVIPVVSVNGNGNQNIKEESLNMPPSTSKRKIINKKKKPNWKLFVSAILAAFIIATLIFSGYIKLKNAVVSESEIVMPILLGLNEEEANAIAAEKEFQINIIDSKSSSEYESGLIMQQNVDEGVRIKKGYPVGVVISLGSKTTTVPMLLNRTISEAQTLLDEAGLRINIIYEFSETVPLDVVIEQSEKATSNVEPNIRIDVTVSKGPEITDVIMIQLVGQPISKALNEIGELDLAVGEIKYEPNEKVEANIVTWQSYDAGTTLETKTAVDLYVSLGPDTTIPVEPTEPEEPTQPPTETEDEGPYTLILTPFSDKTETDVTIFRKQNSNSVLVYSEKHSQSAGSFEVNLSGIPGAEFEVYFDGIYQFTRIKEN